MRSHILRSKEYATALGPKRWLFLVVQICLMAGSIMSALSPKANPGATVVLGNARFTMLTDRLIRLEYARHGNFEDRETLSFAHRALPVPKFTSKKSPNQLTIETSHLRLVVAF